MRVLIVCSYNSGRIAPFIDEQGDALSRAGVEVEYFKIEGKGLLGYFKNKKRLIRKIADFQPDVVHAHYGLSGLLANLQRRVPVVTTYHGSDINDDKVFRFSKLCIRLSAYNVFVSQKNMDKATRIKSFLKPTKNILIPCGVDVELFVTTDKDEARKKLGLNKGEKYILFAGAFDNKVKNAELAKEAVSLFTDVTLLELKGYSREEVVQLMNSVDCVLMTSFTEGSPQFIKEAMACNCPIVSVPVGDVPDVIMGIDGCYISSYEASDIAEKIEFAFNYRKRTDGRSSILELGLESQTVVKRIIGVYESIVNGK